MATVSRGSKKKKLEAIQPLAEAKPIARECGNCGENDICRRRTFSHQAWTVLLLWNEISVGAVDQPICEACYREMREILIDRNAEVEAALERTQEVEVIHFELERRKAG